MATILLKNKRYEKFSPSRFGYAPGLLVKLHLPGSDKVIPEVRALIDTGAEITRVYRRETEIDPSTDFIPDPETGRYIVGVEVKGQTYWVACEYEDHPYAGTEEMLIGTNLLESWFLSMHGRKRTFTVIHL